MDTSASHSSRIETEPLGKMKCGQCGSIIDIRGMRAFSSTPCPTCGDERIVPAGFANYILLDQIGTGGMGTVYRALDPALDRTVALKVLLRSMGQVPQSVEAFQKEAKAAARLNHPCVAHIYAFGVEKGQPYIAMEFLEGQALSDLIEEQGALGEADALRIALHAAMGLHAAWKEGLVHADVKPHNILLDGEGRAKLIDFGLATFASDDTPMDGVWGSPYYMAPERIRRETLDLRADMYGLGAALYHALAGRVPYEGDDVTSVSKAKLSRDAVPPSRYRRGLLRETDRIVCRLLRRNPEERYPTYESLLNDLQRTMDKAAARPLSAVASPKKKGDGNLGDAVRRIGAFTSRFLLGELLDPEDAEKPATGPHTAHHLKVVRPAAGPYTARHRHVTEPLSDGRPTHNTARHSTSMMPEPQTSAPVAAWIVGGLLAMVVFVAIISTSQNSSSNSRPSYTPRRYPITTPPSTSGESETGTVTPGARPKTTVPTSFVPSRIPKRERTYSDSELALNAKDDRQIVKADAETTLDVLQNDEWRGTIFPTLLSVTQPAHGAARVVSQKVAYTPQSGFVGEDSFQYTVQYGTNRTSTATATVQVSSEARTNP